MLATRLSAPRQVVSLLDPALQLLSYDAVHKYSLSRDLSDLGDLPTLAEQPSIFLVSPLLTEHEHWIDGGLSDNSLVLWRIFSTYCTAITGVDCQMLKERDKLRMNDSMREVIPREVVQEIAHFVIELATRDGKTLPFSSPVTSWGGIWAAGRALRALTPSTTAPTN